MIYALSVLTALTAYLLGSINTSIILSKSLYGSDIRSSGSGNAGATNMLRTHGKGMAIATLACDILKGSLAVVLASAVQAMCAPSIGVSAALSGVEQFLFANLKYVAGVFAVLGHDFPLYFGFRGGKGVATSLGVVLALNPSVGLIVCAAALIVMAVSRYVSLGSVTAAGIYPFVLFTYLLASGNIEDGIGHIIMAIILAMLLIGKHHANIKRLLNGTESRLFEKKKPENSSEEK